MHNSNTCEGDREILAELNADAYADYIDDWYTLSDDERDELMETNRLAAEQADLEASLYWEAEAQMIRKAA